VVSHLTRIRTRLTRRDADTISAPSSSAPSAALDTTAPSSSSIDRAPVSTGAPGWYTRPGNDWSESSGWAYRLITDYQTRLLPRPQLFQRLPPHHPPPTSLEHRQPSPRLLRNLGTPRPRPARLNIPPRRHIQPHPLKAPIPPTLRTRLIPLTLPILPTRASGKLLTMSSTLITGCNPCLIPRFLSTLTDSFLPFGWRSEVPLTTLRCGNGWMLVIGRRYDSRYHIGKS
jgi:hypothetical protein